MSRSDRLIVWLSMLALVFVVAVLWWLLQQVGPPAPAPATPVLVIRTPEATMTPLPTATVEPTRPELIVMTPTTRAPLTATPSPTPVLPTTTPRPATPTAAVQRG